MADTIRPAPNPRIARMLTSSGWTGGVSGGIVDCRAWAMSVRLRRPFDRALDDPSERLVELRIVNGQNRAAAKLPDEAPEPDRSERQRKHDVHPAHRDARPVKL